MIENTSPNVRRKREMFKNVVNKEVHVKNRRKWLREHKKKKSSKSYQNAIRTWFDGERLKRCLKIKKNDQKYPKQWERRKKKTKGIFFLKKTVRPLYMLGFMEKYHYKLFKCRKIQKNNMVKFEKKYYRKNGLEI